ncbi:MAG TPA: cyclic nucleotide-binding domain-containing protein, partial [Acidimicrobiales bacterium]|nr:cyclic nucleotide-binding domain-containing protein [Acidimicrobiales bacterium]
MSDQELLGTVELFEELDAGELTSISEASADRALNRGDVLFTEGDEPHELFVVVSGRVAMANRSTDGRESVLALMERGDLFGEMPLFDGLPRSAEARALEPSEVIAIPYEPL